MDIEGIFQRICEADRRIRPLIRQTDCIRSAFLEERSGCEVWVKLENTQHTGSFKVRGAINKVLSLDEEQLARGIVTASTGNHGAAVAYSLRIAGARGLIFVPSDASPAKLSVIERLGGEIRMYGDDNADTEIYARKYAAGKGMVYISPYNDPEVIAGQGTIGPELIRQTGGIDEIFVSLGGGGLLSGIAAYLKHFIDGIRVTGCSPDNSKVMIESVRAGEILDLPSTPTLSDGTAGGLEPGAVTFDLCRSLADDFVTVSEDEIRRAMIEFMEEERMIIEGAAAVAVASFLKAKSSLEGKRVVIVVCGGNISLEKFKRLIER